MKLTAKRLTAATLGLFLFTFPSVPTSVSKFVSEARPLGRARSAIGALADARTSDTTQTKRKSSATEDLFQTNCARCHGADGRGDTPLGHTYNSPDFTDNAWWQKHSDITSTKSLVSIVTNGKGGMPGFGKKLKSSEIKGLVSYVRRFRKVK